MRKNVKKQRLKQIFCPCPKTTLSFLEMHGLIPTSCKLLHFELALSRRENQHEQYYSPSTQTVINLISTVVLGDQKGGLTESNCQGEWAHGWQQ